MGRDQHGEGIGGGDNLHAGDAAGRESEREAQFESVQEDHTGHSEVRGEIGAVDRDAARGRDVLHRVEIVGIPFEPRARDRHPHRVRKASRFREQTIERGAKLGQLYDDRRSRRHGRYSLFPPFLSHRTLSPPLSLLLCSQFLFGRASPWAE